MKKYLDIFLKYYKKYFSKNISLREKLTTFFKNQDIVMTNEQLQMILNVVPLIKADLNKIKIPITKVSSLNIKASLKETLILLQKTRHSRIPVYEEKDGHKLYIGIFFAKDILQLYNDKGTKFNLKDYIRPITFAAESRRLLSLLREMRIKQHHLMLTVNEYGTITGMITLEDILEEIVGDIRDEFDRSKKSIQEINIREYRVDGSIFLSTLNKELAINLPEEKFNTLAGFILHELQGVLRKGKEVRYGSISLKIEKYSGQQIEQVLVKLDNPKYL